MKRDMELIRSLLLRIEGEVEVSLADLISDEQFGEDREKITEHISMLVEEAGLLSGIKTHTLAGKNWLNLRITWDGHEYLDSVRDPDIWDKTKLGAEKVGGFSLDVMKALAKGLIKKKLEHHTGVQIDF